MGIKHFFSWFKRNYPEHINYFKKEEHPKEVQIDVFMIDLNGVFHNSAQKVYEYGNYARPSQLLRRPKVDAVNKQTQVYEEVCRSIDMMVEIVKPKKKLILCVDGTAPLSKQNQQRQRRFRSASETPDSLFKTFDTNSITPGTKFMDLLGKYIDFHIRKKLNTREWGGIEVVFSNEKVPGEGEHKLINYVRKYGEEDDVFCINALDADLFMLSLGTHKKNFYLLRDYNFGGFDYMYVNIGTVREELSEITLRWEGDGYDPKRAINDFILICFMCGNDFLPNIPSIEIMQEGLTTIIEVYKTVGKHLTEMTIEGDVRFIPSEFQIFLGTIAQYEKDLIEAKLNKRENRMPDEILDACCVVGPDGYIIDFEKYIRLYNEKKMGGKVEEVSLKYLEGMQWVLSYYTKGVPTWDWLFPYHYSPFCFDLTLNISSYVYKPFKFNPPTTPFLQLLCVLPTKSAELIPQPLNTLLYKSSPISEFYPEEFKIDYSGKKEKWEGVIILPIVNIEKVRSAYTRLINGVSETEKKRNAQGKSFIYRMVSGDFLSNYRCYWGEIKNCSVGTEVIIL